MEQIKLKEIVEKKVEDLETEINTFLKREESQNYRLLNITVNNNWEHKFASKENEFIAILTLVEKD